MKPFSVTSWIGMNVFALKLSRLQFLGWLFAPVVPLRLLGLAMGRPLPDVGIYCFIVLYLLAVALILVPSRLRDAGRPAWWALLMLIPIMIVPLAFWCAVVMPTKKVVAV
jgi:uncharacterized membrane protein YhaH (DUF805 family)